MAHRTSLLSFVLGLFLASFIFPSVVKATALTYNIAANEKACFYIMNNKPGSKVGFYYAVCSFPSIFIEMNKRLIFTYRFNKVAHLISISMLLDLTATQS